MQNKPLNRFPRVSGPWSLQPILVRLEAEGIEYHPFSLKSKVDSSEKTTHQDHVAMKAILERMQNLVEELEDGIEQLRPVYERQDEFNWINFGPQTMARKVCELLADPTNTGNFLRQYNLQKLTLQRFKAFIEKQQSQLADLKDELDINHFDADSTGSLLTHDESKAQEEVPPSRRHKMKVD